MLQCSKCGYAILAGAYDCARCGTPVTGSEALLPQASSANDDETAKLSCNPRVAAAVQRRYWITLAAGLAAPIGVVAIAVAAAALVKQLHPDWGLVFRFVFVAVVVATSWNVAIEKGRTPFWAVGALILPLWILLLLLPYTSARVEEIAKSLDGQALSLGMQTDLRSPEA